MLKEKDDAVGEGKIVNNFSFTFRIILNYYYHFYCIHLIIIL